MISEDSPPTYAHGPRVPWVILWLPGSIFVASLGVLAAEGRQIDVRAVTIAAVVAFLLAVLIAALLLPRTYKSVRVDGQGLHVSGRLALPAEQIGEIQILDRSLARQKSWALSRGRGTRIKERQDLYGGLFGHGPGVGVQHLDGNGAWRSTWLLPTEDLDALVAALEHAAGTARRRDRPR